MENELDVELECYEEELSPAQVAHHKKQEEEYGRPIKLIKQWKAAGRKVFQTKMSDGLIVYRCEDSSKPSEETEIIVPIVSKAKAISVKTYGSALSKSSIPSASLSSVGSGGNTIFARPKAALINISTSTAPRLPTRAILVPSGGTPNPQIRPVRHSGPIQISTLPRRENFAAVNRQVIPTGSSLPGSPFGYPVINTIHQLLLDPSTGRLMLSPMGQPTQLPQAIQTPVSQNIIEPGRLNYAGNAYERVLDEPASTQVSQIKTSVASTLSQPKSSTTRIGTVKSNPVPYVPKTSSSVSSVSGGDSFCPMILSVTSLNPGNVKPQKKSDVVKTQVDIRTTKPTLPSDQKPVLTNGSNLVMQRNKFNAEQPSSSRCTEPVGLTSKRPTDIQKYPSLVVNVRPCLKPALTREELASARARLDIYMKTFIHSKPPEFVEWLMRRGLIKVDQKCSTHSNDTTGRNKLKLGKYSSHKSDTYSGGYIWIADCCKEKQISVFAGSIFEASTYSPNLLIKMIYHWSCQTPAKSILEWLKVASFYLKNFFTLLRSVCVAAVHELSPLMGGRGRYIEIGIVNIETMSGTPNGKRICILAAFDVANKSIRFKVIKINIMNLEVLQQNLVQLKKILSVLTCWVCFDSVLLIDKNLNKQVLEELGFQYVVQVVAGLAGLPSNANVLNYLKQVVSKVFVNTLNALSNSLIQQFLDELSWRENWGQTSEETFNTILEHLAFMTKCNNGKTLLTRLNEISMNPFYETTHNRTMSAPLPVSNSNVSTSRGPQMPKLRLATVKTNGIQGFQKGLSSVSERKPPLLIPKIEPNTNMGSLKRKAESSMPVINFQHYFDSNERTVGLQSYYYAESPGINVTLLPDRFPENVKCPMCSKVFASNREVVRHILLHLQSMVVRSANSQGFCNYCLKDAGPFISLEAHIQKHKMSDIDNACLICQESFLSDKKLIFHMWEHHAKKDMPYRCEICIFRTSLHCTLVDHFSEEHRGLAVILCPICLKVLPCKSLNCLKLIVVHMQTHVLKRGRRCNCCVLSFLTDQEYRTHLKSHSDDFSVTESSTSIVQSHLISNEIKMAIPPKMKRNFALPAGVTKMPRLHPRPNAPTCLPISIFTASASKTSTFQNSSTSASASRPSTSKSTVSVPQGVVYKDEGVKYNRDSSTIEIVDYDVQRALCVECKEHAASPAHFPGTLSCNRCEFISCCRKSIVRHLKTIHIDLDSVDFKTGIKRILEDITETENMYCECGFLTTDGDTMALHLASCKKTTSFVYEPNDEEENNISKDDDEVENNSNKTI